MCSDTTTTSPSAADAALCSAPIDIWENELPVPLLQTLLRDHTTGRNIFII